MADDKSANSGSGGKGAVDRGGPSEAAGIQRGQSPPEATYGDGGKRVRNAIRTAGLSVGGVGRSILAIEGQLYRARRSDLYRAIELLHDTEKILPDLRGAIRALADLTPEDGPAWPTDVNGEMEP